ncbi:MAG: AMP-binding protein [Acidimicrobiia bacterium]|nr:AMP-binding protein [Acidimicrobiia bacterium]
MPDNLSVLFEAVVDARPDALALVRGAQRLTYSQLDARANKVAQWLVDSGTRPGTHIGLHLDNQVDFFAAMLGCLKAGALPLALSTRLLAAELADAIDFLDIEGLFTETSRLTTVADASMATAGLRFAVVSGDEMSTGPNQADTSPSSSTAAGSTPQITAQIVATQNDIATCSPQRPVGIERGPDDTFMLVTAGRSRRPAGLVWKQSDFFYAALGAGDPTGTDGPLPSGTSITDRLVPSDSLVVMPIARPYHPAGQWPVWMAWFAGGTAVFDDSAAFRPEAILAAASESGVTMLLTTGDAMCRPLAETLAENPVPLPKLTRWVSSGAVWSNDVKALLNRLLPDVDLFDGSSDPGAPSGNVSTMGWSFDESTVFAHGDVALLDDQDLPIEPGSTVIGRLAGSGHIPVGFYRDPKRNERTFVEVEGTRYVISGARARLDTAGRIRLVADDFRTINTGGERVFGQEVESVLRQMPGVIDVVVVGVDDAYWGQRVTAVIQPDGRTRVSLDAVAKFCQGRLASHKIPKSIVLVDSIAHHPDGQPDDGWARIQAQSAI